MRLYFYKFILRIISIASTIFILLSLTGCVTAYTWKNNPVKKVEDVEHDKFTDVIYASFKFDNFYLEKDTTVKSSSNYYNYPPNGIGYMGEKYIYLVKDGYEDLESMNEIIKIIPAERFRSTGGFTRLRYSEPDKINPMPNFSSSYFTIEIKDHNLTNSEVALLKKNRFTLANDGYYSKYINFKGMIFTRDQLKFKYEPNKNLANNYKVQFYTTEREKITRPSRAAQNLALTPLTLVGDILIIPFSLLAFPFLMTNPSITISP